MIRTEIDSMPAELDEVRRRIMQLEIEQAALKKGKRTRPATAVWKSWKKRTCPAA